MGVLLCRRLPRLHLLPTPFFRTLAATASTVASPPPPSSSFTVDFLTSSCGLTPAQALSAARTLRFDAKTRQQPESVLAILRSHGFSDAQIAEVVTRLPRVLLCKAEKKLAPKLQFLSHAGFPSALIAQEPGVLMRSLDRHIRPCFQFLRCFLGLPEDVQTVFRRYKWFLNYDMKTTMIPNAGVLLELGVAAPAISKLIVTHPRSLMKKREFFAETVQVVQDWGLAPEKNLFVHAVRALCGMSRSTLEKRLELFKKLGWSEEQFLSAFRRAPLCVLISDQKLMRMNSFARKLGLGPSDLSRWPKLLMYGFDTRILPRYAVWQVLSSKGLIKQRTNKLVSMFLTSEKMFLDRYVTRYVDKVPEVLDVYIGKINVEGLDLCGEEKSKQKL